MAIEPSLQAHLTAPPPTLSKGSTGSKPVWSSLPTCELLPVRPHVADRGMTYHGNGGAKERPCAVGLFPQGTVCLPSQ